MHIARSDALPMKWNRSLAVAATQRTRSLVAWELQRIVLGARQGGEPDLGKRFAKGR
jgi:hypothetical protein